MNIETYLADAGAPYQVHDHPTAYSGQELAAAEHVSGHTVAKAVVVRVDGHDVLCVLPASCKLDFAKLTRATSASRCRLADEAELAGLFPDVEIGAEPPFGEPYGLRTLVDRRLGQCRTITFNAGTHARAIQMAYADYERVAQPEVVDLACGD